VLKDLRALVRWLYKEDLLPELIEVPVPKLPQHYFPVLTQDEMTRVWQSSYLRGRSSMAIRNRAVLGLMLDTGIRRAEVCGLALSRVM
jgi:site-specific recombinase XerD